ncbi:transglycosylase SLT domain-containing protein [Rhodobacterales bacterium HKCCE2091]|nr:transglycosylase SLT domain-containing protein [Rhodobacterales bacterium HKCCE2091]
MRKLVLAVLIALAPIAAHANPEALSQALSAVSQRDFTLAEETARRIEDPAARDVVVWSLLRARHGSFDDYEDFVARNPDWPGMDYLRLQGEYAIPRNGDPARVIAWFGDTSPQTGTGALRLAGALQAQGGDPAPVVIEAWTTMTLSAAEETAFLTDYGHLLEDHHVARLDTLLWRGEEARAQPMLTLVPGGWRDLAEARLALRARRGGVDDLIAAVPEDLAGDPGLAFERFVWRMQSGFWDTATDLLEETSTSAEALGRPEAWADRRATLARDVMREGEWDRGYALAANHFVDPEVDYLAYSDLEWLAGYAALHRDDPETAAEHFENFRDTVFSPISVGRAGYWLGRAHEAAGNADAAAEAYALGAQYQSSFYGQLAAERGGLPTDPAFLGEEEFSTWRTQPFLQSSVLQAGLTLYQAGESALAERFLTHLSESLDREQAGSLGDLALDLGDPHLALRIAKRVAQSGHEIMRAYYPLTELADADLPAPAALTLSIARRESEFDPAVRSGAGALGLMQVMPRTGRETARRLGLSFSERRLTTDPEYNAILGAGYLAALIEEFGDNPVLVAAAYNAGPSRAHAWSERFGDPTDPEVDIVDWIEAVPFEETRNYIMRVTESLAIYEAQLTGELPPSNLSERLRSR